MKKYPKYSLKKRLLSWFCAVMLVMTNLLTGLVIVPLSAADGLGDIIFYINNLVGGGPMSNVPVRLYLISDACLTTEPQHIHQSLPIKGQQFLETSSLEGGLVIFTDLDMTVPANYHYEARIIDIEAAGNHGAMGKPVGINTAEHFKPEGFSFMDATDPKAHYPAENYEDSYWVYGEFEDDEDEVPLPPLLPVDDAVIAIDDDLNISEFFGTTIYPTNIKNGLSNVEGSSLIIENGGSMQIEINYAAAGFFGSLLGAKYTIDFTPEEAQYILGVRSASEAHKPPELERNPDGSATLTLYIGDPDASHAFSTGSGGVKAAFIIDFVNGVIPPGDARIKGESPSGITGAFDVDATFLLGSTRFTTKANTTELDGARTLDINFTADEEWNITKAVKPGANNPIAKTDVEPKVVEVVYTIKAELDGLPSGAPRLFFDNKIDGHFVITDSFVPLPASGGYKTPDGLPTVTSVKMGSTELLGNGAVYNSTTSTLKITDKYNTSDFSSLITDENHIIPNNHDYKFPVTTEYEVTVTFPYDAYYREESVDPDFAQTLITNTAKLDYKLIGGAAKDDEDTADVTIGGVANRKSGATVNVNKSFNIGSAAVGWNGGDIDHGNGIPKFALVDKAAWDAANYSAIPAVLPDAILARSLDPDTRTFSFIQPVEYDGSMITFSNVYPGEYYIVEQVWNSEFDGITYTLVGGSDTEWKDGETASDNHSPAITVVSNQTSTVNVKNSPSTLGALEFQKYVEDISMATGYRAAKDGVKFYLIKNDAYVSGKPFTGYAANEIYEASTLSGWVRFTKIAAGDYMLVEDPVSLASQHPFFGAAEPIAITIMANSVATLESVTRGDIGPIEKDGREFTVANALRNKTSMGDILVIKYYYNEDGSKINDNGSVNVGGTWSGATFGVYYDEACENPVPSPHYPEENLTFTIGVSLYDDGTNGPKAVNAGRAQVPELEGGGQYWVKEIEETAPHLVNYRINDVPQSVTVAAGQTAPPLFFDNYYKLSRIKIEKKDLEGTAVTNLTAMKLAVYADAAGIPGAVIPALNGVSVSTVESYQFEAGKKYWIAETEPPAGHALPESGASYKYTSFILETQNGTSSEDDFTHPLATTTKVTLKNPKLASVQLHKYEYDLTKPDNIGKDVLGAVFKLEKRNTSVVDPTATNAWANISEGHTTDAAGLTPMINGLDVGLYRFVEVTIPSEYSKHEAALANHEAYQFTVSYGDENDNTLVSTPDLVEVNNLPKANLIIKNFDYDNSTKELNQSLFTVYRDKTAGTWGSPPVSIDRTFVPDDPSAHLGASTPGVWYYNPVSISLGGSTVATAVHPGDPVMIPLDANELQEGGNYYDGAYSKTYYVVQREVENEWQYFANDDGIISGNATYVANGCVLVQEVTLKPSETKTLTFKNVGKATINITKYKNELNRQFPLHRDVTFELYYSLEDANSSEVSPITTKTTNNLGELQFTGLDPHLEYWVKEITPTGEKSVPGDPDSFDVTYFDNPPFKVEFAPAGVNIGDYPLGNGGGHGGVTGNKYQHDQNVYNAIAMGRIEVQKSLYLPYNGTSSASAGRPVNAPLNPESGKYEDGPFDFTGQVASLYTDDAQFRVFRTDLIPYPDGIAQLEIDLDLIRKGEADEDLEEKVQDWINSITNPTLETGQKNRNFVEDIFSGDRPRGIAISSMLYAGTYIVVETFAGPLNSHNPALDSDGWQMPECIVSGVKRPYQLVTIDPVPPYKFKDGQDPADNPYSPYEIRAHDNIYNSEEPDVDRYNTNAWPTKPEDAPNRTYTGKIEINTAETQFWNRAPATGSGGGWGPVKHNLGFRKENQSGMFLNGATFEVLLGKLKDSALDKFVGGDRTQGLLPGEEILSTDIEVATEYLNAHGALSGKTVTWPSRQETVNSVNVNALTQGIYFTQTNGTLYQMNSQYIPYAAKELADGYANNTTTDGLDTLYVIIREVSAPTEYVLLKEEFVMKLQFNDSSDINHRLIPVHTGGSFHDSTPADAEPTGSPSYWDNNNKATHWHYPLVITNIKDVAHIQVNKVDGRSTTDPKKPLDGAVFILWITDGDTRHEWFGGSANPTRVTTGDGYPTGTAVFENVPYYGPNTQYYAVEIIAPEGYDGDDLLPDWFFYYSGSYPSDWGSMTAEERNLWRRANSGVQLLDDSQVNRFAEKIDMMVFGEDETGTIKTYSVTVENLEKAKLRVLKEDPSGKAIGGATFDVYRTGSYYIARDDYLETIVTDSITGYAVTEGTYGSGYYAFVERPWGDDSHYYISRAEWETYDPDLPATYPYVGIEINKDTGILEGGIYITESLKLVNEVKTPVTVWKRGIAPDGQTILEGGLADATFAVYLDNDRDNPVISPRATGADGKYTFWLEPGRYWIEEKSAPANYNIIDGARGRTVIVGPDSVKTVNADDSETPITDANHTIPFFNTSGNGGLQIAKRDLDGNEITQIETLGTVFLVYGQVDDGIGGLKWDMVGYSDNSLVQPEISPFKGVSAIISTDGDMLFPSLPSGTYRVVEYIPPAGFSKNAVVSRMPVENQVINAAGNALESKYTTAAVNTSGITFTDIIDGKTVELVGYEVEITGSARAGIEFRNPKLGSLTVTKLHAKEPHIPLGNVKFTLYQVCVSESGPYEVTDWMDGKGFTGYTNPQGVLVFTDLPTGDYILIEGRYPGFMIPPGYSPDYNEDGEIIYDVNGNISITEVNDAYFKGDENIIITITDQTEDESGNYNAEKTIYNSPDQGVINIENFDWNFKTLPVHGALFTATLLDVNGLPTSTVYEIYTDANGRASQELPSGVYRLVQADVPYPYSMDPTVDQHDWEYDPTYIGNAFVTDYGKQADASDGSRYYIDIRTIAGETLTFTFYNEEPKVDPPAPVKSTLKGGLKAARTAMPTGGNSSDNLVSGERDVQFVIENIYEGGNGQELKNFTVTDPGLSYRLFGKVANTYDDMDVSETAPYYHLTEIEIGRAEQADGADIYARVILTARTGVEYTLAPVNITDGPQTITIPETNRVSFKVQYANDQYFYTGVGREFVPGGITVTAHLYEWSTADESNQPRGDVFEVVNEAGVSFEYTIPERKKYDGGILTGAYSEQTPKISEDTEPAVYFSGKNEVKTPSLDITKKIKDGGTEFEPGRRITFQIEVKNTSTTEPFTDIVIADKFPPSDLTLVYSSLKMGIKNNADGRYLTEDGYVTEYMKVLSWADANAYGGVGGLIPLTNVNYYMWILAGQNVPEYLRTLPPGHSLIMEFDAIVSQFALPGTMTNDAFVSSTKFIQPTYTNENGVSWSEAVSPAGSMINNPDIEGSGKPYDAAVFNDMLKSQGFADSSRFDANPWMYNSVGFGVAVDNKYMNYKLQVGNLDPEFDVYTTDAEGVEHQQYILDTNRTAAVSFGGTIKYQIGFINNTRAGGTVASTFENIRLIDMFPMDGDYEHSRTGMTRGTTYTGDRLELSKITNVPDGASVYGTILPTNYFKEHPDENPATLKQVGTKGTFAANFEAPNWVLIDPKYYDTDDSSYVGEEAAAVYLRQFTGIGVDFGANELESGGHSLWVDFEMHLPDPAAGIDISDSTQVNERNDLYKKLSRQLLNNSTYGLGQVSNGAIPINAESNIVKAQPKGLKRNISGYVWHDVDYLGYFGDSPNDISSKPKTPIAGVTVYLVQCDEDGEPVAGGITRQTKTNAAGYYEFTDLPATVDATVADYYYKITFDKPVDHSDADNPVEFSYYTKNIYTPASTESPNTDKFIEMTEGTYSKVPGDVPNGSSGLTQIVSLKTVDIHHLNAGVLNLYDIDFTKTYESENIEPGTEVTISIYKASDVYNNDYLTKAVRQLTLIIGEEGTTATGFEYKFEKLPAGNYIISETGPYSNLYTLQVNVDHKWIISDTTFDGNGIPTANMTEIDADNPEYNISKKTIPVTLSQVALGVNNKDSVVVFHNIRGKDGEIEITKELTGFAAETAEFEFLVYYTLPGGVKKYVSAADIETNGDYTVKSYSTVEGDAMEFTLSFDSGDISDPAKVMTEKLTKTIKITGLEYADYIIEEISRTDYTVVSVNKHDNSPLLTGVNEAAVQIKDNQKKHVTFTNELKKGSLTLSKALFDADGDPSTNGNDFHVRLERKNPNTGDYDWRQDIILKSDGTSVTITDLPYGEYMLTEHKETGLAYTDVNANEIAMKYTYTIGYYEGETEKSTTNTHGFALDGDKTFEIRNRLKKDGKLIIEKDVKARNGTDPGLTGNNNIDFIYEIYIKGVTHGEERTVYLKSGAGNKLNIDNLTPDTYQITEVAYWYGATYIDATTAPAGGTRVPFVTYNPYTVTVEAVAGTQASPAVQGGANIAMIVNNPELAANTAEVKITNKEKLTSLTVTKKVYEDDVGAVNTEGIMFELIKVDSDGNPVSPLYSLTRSIPNYTHPDFGEAVFNDIDFGSYILREYIRVGTNDGFFPQPLMINGTVYDWTFNNSGDDKYYELNCVIDVNPATNNVGSGYDITVTNMHSGVMTINKLLEGYPEDWGVTDDRIFTAHIWDVTNEVYLKFDKYEPTGTDPEEIIYPHYTLGGDYEMIEFSADAPAIITGLMLGTIIEVREYIPDDNTMSFTVSYANNISPVNKITVGEDNISVFITNTFDRKKGSLEVKKTLSGSSAARNITNNTQFTAKIKNADTDEYLILTGTAPDYVYASENAEGTAITFSVNAPAVITGIPIGLNLIVEETPGSNYTASYLPEGEVTIVNDGTTDKVSVAVDNKYTPPPTPPDNPPDPSEDPSEDPTTTEPPTTTTEPTTTEPETTTEEETTTTEEETTSTESETTTAEQETTTAETPTTTESETITTEPAIDEPTTETTTQSTSEQTTATATTVTTGTTENTTNLQTIVDLLEDKEVFFESPEGAVPLSNGWFAVDLGDDLWEIFSESGVPLGFVWFDGDITDWAFDNLIPFTFFAFDENGHIIKPEARATEPVEVEEAKKNPPTGDGVLNILILLAVMALSCAGFVFIFMRRRTGKA